MQPKWLRKSEVNARAWEALRAVVAQASANNGQPTPAYTNAWFKRRGAAWAYGTAAWIASLISVIVAAQGLEKPGKALFILGWLALGGVAATIAAVLGGMRMSTEEVEALASLAKLDPAQRNYLDALVRLHRSDFSTDFRQELRDHLNALMSDFDRLREQRASLSGVLGDVALSDAIQEDVARLALRVEHAADPSARETYRESLELAQKRLKRLEEGTPMLQRIDAQIELIEQTTASFSDSMRAMVDTHSPTAEIDDLRARIGAVRSQTEAIATAYEDVRGLG